MLNIDRGGDIEDSDEFDTDLEDGEPEDAKVEEEKESKAPNELFMEVGQSHESSVSYYGSLF